MVGLFDDEAFPFLLKGVLFNTGLEKNTISVILPPENPTNTNFMRIEDVTFSFADVGIHEYRLDENMVLHYRRNCECHIIPSEHSVKLHIYGEDGQPAERFFIMGQNDYGITLADCLVKEKPADIL